MHTHEMCARKSQYATFELAKRACRVAYPDTSYVLWPYKCERGNHFHIGRPSREDEQVAYEQDAMTLLASLWPPT